MSNKERLPRERVNFFDGQQITEDDLDTEQIYHQVVASEMVMDFHGSGVLNLQPFEENILLDTRSPGQYCATGEENSSKIDIENGEYDGKGINVDIQPTDNVRGNRIAIQLVDVNIVGRNKPRILVVGRTFDGLDSSGILNYEVLEFDENTTKVTDFYYQRIIAIFFNNFSGGTGKNEFENEIDSLNLVSENSGYAIIKEAESLSVFAKPVIRKQILSPNYDLMRFITSSTSNDISTEINIALDASSNINDLFIDLEGNEQVSFDKDGETTIAYGQKFLSTTNNLQRIDLLLSVEEDITQDAGNEFDWTGDLVIGIYKISDQVKCISDAVPDELIEFEPELNPLLEVSFSQEDFENFGYKLNSNPQLISFNFAGTLLADPNIEPSLEKNKYYAFILTRRGDNRTGTIKLEKGYDTVFQKEELGITLSIKEQFAKQDTRFFEFDAVRGRYIDDPEASLWFKIYSDNVEVISGVAYSDNGKCIQIPKTESYVGGNEISHYEDNIPLSSILSSNSNYITLNHIEKFTHADTHPSTGNFTFTRIQDAATSKALDESKLSEALEDTIPVILARVTDNNARDGVSITGELSNPGQIYQNKILIINPSTTLLSNNLIGYIITPDSDCTCTARYRIVDTICREEMAGDLDGDNELTQADIGALLNVVGKTLNSSATEKEILSGDLELLDFIKSDLNNDGTIDGSDIELLEQAVDGYSNFTISEKIKTLELILENVLEDSDYPILFTDEASSGTIDAASNIISFSTTTTNEALAIRAGDKIEVLGDVDDIGTYLISSKTIDTDGLSVQLEVTELDGDAVSFAGSTSFNVEITSGTRVNTFADNLTLLDVPYSTKNYTISYVDFPFTERFLDICDLRRFVGTAFSEEIAADPYACDTSTSCAEDSICEPVYKTQHYFPGDIYIPNGNILTEPGIPHPGDYEFVNISIPLPPGTISDCTVNIYDTFIKYSSDCKTSAGFPAMKYSDGTYVGTGDSGSVTDLSLGRVKITQGIGSLYVDALVDGYAVDGYADAEISSENSEAITESFIDYSYTRFDSWIENAFNDATFGSVTRPSGTVEAAIFDVTTINSSGTKYVKIVTPVASQNLEDDFLIDFTARRVAWPQSSLTSGIVSAVAIFEITNTDSSTSTLEVGWRGVGGTSAKIYYSGVIRDELGIIQESFEFLEDAPDEVGEDVLFRVRRTDDAILVYYILPERIGESDSEFGHYIRLGTNPDRQPGSGTVTMSYEVSQTSSPNSGKNFIINLSEVVLRSQYSNASDDTTISIGRTADTSEINRVTCNFPINLSSSTNIVSATLEMTTLSSGTINDTFNIIPLDVLNVSNLGRSYNIPETQESSTITSFTPGTLTVNGTLSVDVTSTVLSLMAESGHLPGFAKGFIIEPGTDTDSSFTISSELTLTITYEELTTGVIFKIGVSIDPETSIATFNTKNILYDSLIEENRTVINFGVHLKKSGFKNSDVRVTIADLSRIGVGTCQDESVLTEDDECFFVVGNTATGTFIDGPFPCSFSIG